jgi:hypothetical protein
MEIIKDIQNMLVLYHIKAIVKELVNNKIDKNYKQRTLPK